MQVYYTSQLKKSTTLDKNFMSLLWQGFYRLQKRIIMNKEVINECLVRFGRRDDCEDGERIFYLVLLINCDDDGFVDLYLGDLVNLTAMHPNRIYRARSRLQKKNVIKIHKSYSKSTGKIENTAYEVLQ